jgi:predicted permease
MAPDLLSVRFEFSSHSRECTMIAFLTRFRHAWRSLRRSPGATLISMAVLGLGVGVATALFSLYNALVLRPVAVPHGRQYQMISLDYGQNYTGMGMGVQKLRELGRPSSPVEAVVLEGHQTVRAEAGEMQASLEALPTSPNYFTTLGVRPRLGMGYTEKEPGVVVSTSLWRRAFGNASSLAGASIRVNGVWLPVLGVAPEDFQGLSLYVWPDLWFPADAIQPQSPEELQAYANHGDGDLPAFARLAPGASARQGEAALQPQVQAWRIEGCPDAPRVSLSSMDQGRRGIWMAFMPHETVLWAAVGLLLLLACLNVAQLQSARAFQLRREEATRLALGSTPGNLLADMAMERCLLVALGAALALPVAMLVARGLAGLMPPGLGNYTLKVHLDLRVLGFALALLALMTLSLVGSTAWRLTHLQPMDDLRGGTGGGFQRLGPAHRALLGVQIALALALLWSALSVLGGLRRTLRQPLGMDIRHVEVVSLTLPEGTDPAVRKSKLAELRRRVEALPGVDSATVSATSPLEPMNITLTVVSSEDGSRSHFLANMIGPSYFRTLRIPILEGHEFEDTGDGGATGPMEAVFTRSQAAQFFPGAASVAGRTLNGLHIIGVVEDHVQKDLKFQPRAFMALNRVSINFQCLVIRSSLPEATLISRVDREIATVDPRWTILKSEPLGAKLTRQQQPQRLASALLGGLGILAAILAFTGVFGLQSHLTAQRTREAGMRVALGATPGSVAWTFTRGLFLPLGSGLAGGVLLVLLGRGVLVSQLGDLGTVGWPGLLGAASALALTALTAAWTPALRAATMPPSQALRTE